MKIACLGWGSLIWRPEGLKIQNKWFEDGPILPIEFTRQSKDGRMTLIIDKQAKPVRVLWALMHIDKLPEAVESLMMREGTKKESIEVLRSSDSTEDAIKSGILEWLKSKQLDAAIWTGLSFSEGTNNERPTIESVINYLSKLDYNAQKHAEEYVRKAPRQVDTEYRRRIEQEFGWTCTV